MIYSRFRVHSGVLVVASTAVVGYGNYLATLPQVSQAFLGR